MGLMRASVVCLCCCAAVYAVACVDVWCLMLGGLALIFLQCFAVFFSVKGLGIFCPYFAPFYIQKWHGVTFGRFMVHKVGIFCPYFDTKTRRGVMWTN